VSGHTVSFCEGVLSDAPFPDSTFPRDVDGRSVSFLFRCLCNHVLERTFSVAEGISGVPFPADAISLLLVEAVEEISCDCDVSIETACSLFSVIVGIGAAYLPLFRHVRWDHLRAELLSVFCEIDCGAPSESVWPGLSHLVRPFLLLPPIMTFDSLIISEFSPLFAEFGEERFPLPWRGSRDGFCIKAFHRRRDGHAPTVMLIEDTAENIFGGFTPVVWDSSSW
jgi:hypothetical protein